MVLDSFQITENRNLEARIEAAQLGWLKNDLGSIPTGTPIIVTIHVPLLSGAVAYAFPGANSNSQLVVANAHERPAGSRQLTAPGPSPSTFFLSPICPQGVTRQCDHDSRVT